ncbi:MAG: hypothetical protein ACD_58C00029G0003 [uncultured bacterium]|nr:MAG: hypothetical protein ACD_58C00029G0003 [uncultured bacterium]
MKKLSTKFIIWTIIVLLVVWFFRPFFHGLIMSFYISPLKGILILAILIGIYYFTGKFGKIKLTPTGMGIGDKQNYSINTANKVSAKIVASFFVFLFVVSIMLGLESEIRLLVTSKQVDYDQKTDLPNFEPIRLIPKPVAARFASDSFQNPQEHLGDSQIVMMDGKLQRVMPRLPDGTWLYFFNKLNGFVTVDVDTLDKKVSIEDKQFKYSEGIGIFDNLHYQLPLKKYFVQYSSEPIYLKNDKGEWVTVVPYMSYRGLIFRVPYWAGVMVVSADGTFTDYTPEQAQEISYFKNNRLYPKELVNYYTESYSYKGGLINLWFLHKNQIETVSLPGSEFVLHASTDEGFKQIVVAEPYGRSYGIYKIFIFDATTGKREIIEYSQDSQLTGPVAAADYIKREFPSYSWDSFSLSEPRPMKISGDLYWLMSIVPNDAAGIAKTVLFNAKTNKVVAFDDLATLDNFVKTGTLTTKPVTTTPTPADTNAEIKAKLETLQQDLNALKNLVK